MNAKGFRKFVSMRYRDVINGFASQLGDTTGTSNHKFIQALSGPCGYRDDARRHNERGFKFSILLDEALSESTWEETSSCVDNINCS